MRRFNMLKMPILYLTYNVNAIHSSNIICHEICQVYSKIHPKWEMSKTTQENFWKKKKTPFEVLLTK